MSSCKHGNDVALCDYCDIEYSQLGDAAIKLLENIRKNNFKIDKLLREQIIELLDRE